MVSVKKRNARIGCLHVLCSELDKRLMLSSRYARRGYEYDGPLTDSGCHESASDGCMNSSLSDHPLARKSWIDSEYSNDEAIPKVRTQCIGC